MYQNQFFLVVFATEIFLSASIVFHSGYRNLPIFHLPILLLFNQLKLWFWLLWPSCCLFWTYWELVFPSLSALISSLCHGELVGFSHLPYSCNLSHSTTKHYFLHKIFSLLQFVKPLTYQISPKSFLTCTALPHVQGTYLQRDCPSYIP